MASQGAGRELLWTERARQAVSEIAYFLEKEYGVKLSVPKTYEILSEKYKLRSKCKKNKPRGATPEAFAPREVVQMDTSHALRDTIDFGSVFAFTAVDIFSREADILLRPSLTSEDGRAFLSCCMPRRFSGRVTPIQTDGGSEFEGRFAQSVSDYCERHRIARPYKKDAQSFIESFNRTVRKECLGWSKYQPDEIPELTQQVEQFLHRYHYHRPHLAFNPMRPPLPPISTEAL